MAIIENVQSINDHLQERIYNFPESAQIVLTKVLYAIDLIENHDLTIDYNPTEFISKRSFAMEKDLILINLFFQFEFF